jgi:hypothetical protein
MHNSAVVGLPARSHKRVKRKGDNSVQHDNTHRTQEDTSRNCQKSGLACAGSGDLEITDSRYCLTLQIVSG